jgi:hypothetical protein
MSTRTPNPQPSRPRPIWWIAGGLLALGVAFGAGRLTAAPEPRAGARAAPDAPAAAASRATSTEARQEAWAQPVPTPAAPGVASAGAPVGGAPPAGAPGGGDAAAPTAEQRGYRTILSPVLLAEYKAELAGQLEEQRPKVLSACRDQALPRGQRSATVTYNVTFDPRGKEVGRGMVQDRRAPAGKLGKCIGRLRPDSTTLSRPPGTYVTLRVPVTYP